MSTVEEVLASGALRTVFQPIVDLDAGTVVGYEALTRGPAGPLERPDALFAAARAAGRLADLDRACLAAALRAAVAARLFAPSTLFVNVEPEVLDSAPLDDLVAITQAAAGHVQVVLEITERALSVRPADLLRTVARVRELGWAVALDDVGADTLSLAFMPLLRPDVVKLDLRLVQERPGPAIAEIMNAVNAYAERSGALVLAEGIEDDRHLMMARALGARLGQGWMFGRPAAEPTTGYRTGRLVLPAATVAEDADASPFACLPDTVTLRRSPKSLLIELSKHLEREAVRLGPTCVVAATFQELRHFTPATAHRYRNLAERTGFVCAVGEDLPTEPAPGVRGAALSPSDPVHTEWDVTVISPHFAAALLARDLGDTGPDMDRMFEYALTYDRDTVARATNALLLRVAPKHDAPSKAPAPERLAAIPVPRERTDAAGPGPDPGPGHDHVRGTEPVVAADALHDTRTRPARPLASSCPRCPTSRDTLVRMNHVGIERDACPSRSPDHDACIRAADHLDAHRRDTDGRQWSGGVHRAAAWVTREVPVQGSGPRTDAWHIVKA